MVCVRKKLKSNKEFNEKNNMIVASKDLERKDGAKGITLIALVITIIVLLILAAVSIATLTGDNGILTKAQNAQNLTDEKTTKERVQVEVLGSYDDNGKFQMEDLKENLKNHLGVNDITENSDGSITFPLDGYNVTVRKEDEKITIDVEKNENSEVAKDEEKPEVSHRIENITNPEYEPPTFDIPTGGTIYTDGNDDKAPIPSGFSHKEGTVKDGLVVTAPDGSEFVWVPVPYAVVESEEKAEQKLKGSATIKIEATDKGSGIESITNVTEENITKNSDTEYVVTENGSYIFKITDRAGNSVDDYTVEVTEIETLNTGNKALAVRVSENDYRGLVYIFTGSGDDTSSNVVNGCTTNFDNSNTCKEPANLDTSCDNTTKIQGWSTTMYKSEYKEMAESVEKYGGFYVGRYETSINGSNVASKGGVSPMTTEPTSGNMWYGMYNKQKSYASSIKVNGKEVVGSSMIWGSQWQAMLNWILTGKDKSKVTANSAKYQGNTGNPNDVMNKIYDLGNNLTEWSLRAYYPGARWTYGGDYSGIVNTPWGLTPIPPTYDTLSFIGSRLTLYIK